MASLHISSYDGEVYSLRCLFYSVLKVHPHHVTIKTKNKPHNLYKYFHVIIGLLTSLVPHLHSNSVPSVWGWLRSKQLLELHQTLFFPPNTWKKVVWPRETNAILLVRWFRFAIESHIKKFADICYTFVHGKNASWNRHVQYISIEKPLKI